MTDLAEEFSRACCSIDADRLAELQAAGVHTHHRDGAQLVGMALVQVHRGGLFEPADVGDAAVLVPCGWWDGMAWVLDDLVAFHLNQPDRWWRRLGVADVLGHIGFSVEPRRLHPTPLVWLQDGGRGLCLLDWGMDPVDLLAGAGALVADRSLFKRLRKATVTAAVARLDRMVCHG